jgi:hypothetical protein
MKSKKAVCARLLLWSLALLLAAPPGGIMAQGQDSGGQPTFMQEELDQMLAPIALYPDDLLAQVLMAATYPLEVVEAARWVQANPGLSGDQLAAALEQQDWDPSVKSLVSFPSVLQMLSDRLDWTQKLGDAFLAQKDQVMDTVQKLRQRAQSQGYLQTTSQEKVVVDPQSQAIDIEPADPQVIYVPAYDPTVVYGPWWWPAYPPYYYYPPGLVITGGFIGFRVALGLAWGYAWGGFDWHRHDVLINVTRNERFNNRIDRNRYESHVTAGGGGQGAWKHDPAHRRGVAYRTPSVAQQFGRGPRPGASARQDFRGFESSAPGRGAVQGPIRQAPAQQRVAAAPAQPRGAAAPFQQRVAAPPAQQRVAPPPAQQRGAAPPAQQRVAAAPVQARPEAPRQVSSPGRQEVQGMRSPTAFGSGSPGNQVRQESSRGHESLSSARASAPAAGRPSPAPRGPSGGASRGGRNR